MVSIPVSRKEVDAGLLEPKSASLATGALREDGIVVLEDIVDLDHIRILRERALEDVAKLAERDDTHFNWHRGNLQQEPPPFPPYLFRDVLANDIVIQVTSSILGPGMFNAFYSGNTAMPSDLRQPVHADLGQLWLDQETAHPAYGLVVNVGLVDMSPENGSTEIWPGTHLDTSVAWQSDNLEASEEKLERRRSVCPPVQPTVRQGRVIVRDLRLWHAGMPNRTLQPRPMIAMIHYVSWWHADPFELHPDAEELLRHPGLRQHATYTRKAGKVLT